MSLRRVESKVLSGRRLDAKDAAELFQSDDIFELGRLADHVARSRHGSQVYYIHNHHINPTNICVNRCKFCAFSRSRGDRGAYEMSVSSMLRKLRREQSRTLSSLSEVHIVGGLHPDWSLDFYLHLLRTIKEAFPGLHIKAFTAVEIDYFTQISGLSLTAVLQALQEAGLDSMPGGGAEIFSRKVRNRICPEKISGRRWLKIMEAAHKLGIRSNATMLYGHVETWENRIEHMMELRALQDRTDGFQAFIPLAFHPMNTHIEQADYTSGIDDLKTMAVARLVLDNFAHLKAYWVMLGQKIAQLALLFGANDLDGTIIDEKITRSAGSLSGGAMTEQELRNLITKAGKVPVQRDSYYQPVVGHG